MATKKQQPKQPKPPRAADKLNAMGIDILCERLIAGDTQTAIAADLGVSIGSLIGWIAADTERSARAREARITAASSYSDKAEAVLSEAADPFELAKARELASHYRWKASKANPREYGEKVQSEHSGPDGGPLQIERIERVIVRPANQDT